MNINKLDNKIKNICVLISFFSCLIIFFTMFIIVIDVVGRVFFNSPLRGTPEIVKTSIPAIVFLMVPWAVNEGKLVQSTLIKKHVPQFFQKLIDIISYTIGGIFFIGIVFASWKQTVYAFKILEFEGEGALRVPTYPIRAVIIITCILAAWNCMRRVNLIIHERIN